MSQMTVDIAQPNATSMMAPEAAKSALSILVLDDDIQVRETMCAMLGSLGMAVSCADSADAFFKQLDRARFDVVILDLVLPDCDGLEVLGRLAPLQDCQVVIASGSGKRVLQTAKLSAEAAGVDVLGILPKPLRRKDLKDLLSNATKCKKAGTTRRKPAPRPEIDVPMLRNAIEQRHIICHLQPKIRLRDGVPYGFEALARWNDASGCRVWRGF